jgi:hypothetical protein
MSNKLIAKLHTDPRATGTGHRLSSLILFCLLLLTACNYPDAAAMEDQKVDEAATNAAATVSAQLTRVAGVLAEAETPTATPVFPGVEPRITLTPTLIPPTSPPPTPTPYSCNWAAFVPTSPYPMPPLWIQEKSSRKRGG